MTPFFLLKKVITLFSKPQKKMIFKAMIGIMNQTNFVTGSCVQRLWYALICSLTYTCDSMLELPHTYINFDDLCKDFQSIFDATNNELSVVILNKVLSNAVVSVASCVRLKHIYSPGP